MPDTYDRMEQAVAFIESRLNTFPSLETIARAIGLSPYHFQRLFRRWVGISQKKYMQARILEKAKTLLRRGSSSASARDQLSNSSVARAFEYSDGRHLDIFRGL